MELATAENGWINTVDSQHPETIAKARQIIASNLYCTLSTCSANGLPWASPVFFAYDAAWNLYWSSAIAAQHSQNLYHNHGRAAIAIFNSQAAKGNTQGLYLQGTASEVAPEQIASLMTLLFDRAGRRLERTPSDYLGDSPRRIYQFQPQEAWITGDRLPVGNQLVDTKIQLNLTDLIQ